MSGVLRNDSDVVLDVGKPRSKCLVYCAPVSVCLHKIPRALWLPLGGIVLAGFLICVVILPVYFGSYRKSSGAMGNWDSKWAVVPPVPEFSQYSPDEFFYYRLFQCETKAECDVDLDTFILYLTYVPAKQDDTILTQISIESELWPFGANIYSPSGVASDIRLNLVSPNASALVVSVDGQVTTLKQGDIMPSRASLTYTLYANGTTKGPNYYPFDVYYASFTVLLKFEAKDGTVLSPDEVASYVPWGVIVDVPPAILVSNSRITILANTTSVYEVAGVPVNITLEIYRSGLTKFFSMFVVILMWALSLGVLWLSVDFLWIRSRDPTIDGISMCLALLFALPSVRNAQPGIPPVGIAIDVWGFYWNMALTAVAACFAMNSYFAFTHATRWEKPAVKQR